MDHDGSGLCVRAAADGLQGESNVHIMVSEFSCTYCSLYSIITYNQYATYRSDM